MVLLEPVIFRSDFFQPLKIPFPLPPQKTSDELKSDVESDFFYVYVIKCQQLGNLHQ